MTAARLKLGAQALAVGLVALLLALLVWKLAKGNGKEAALGKSAPNFTLSRIDKTGSLQLASLRGKVVVLNFWASWCYPCKQEAPALAAASKRWPGRVVVLGVDVNDFAGDARKFARKYGLQLPARPRQPQRHLAEVRRSRCCPRRSSSTGAARSSRTCPGR